ANSLYAGGQFLTAGGKVSAYLAKAMTGVVPALKIQLVGANAVLSWPLAEQGWVLKKGNNLSGWNAVTEPVVDTATEHTIITPRGDESKQFFRLEK
ncbi:MAG: hypothetical protein K9M97_04145, partial [Akkermansiaceae bacterium]|nr:hypothetical protein [Akkermansiaceae bacterium]